ncbi:MAG: hypothetical protein ABIN89_14600 [Chitinophagaceae bacterium]
MKKNSIQQEVLLLSGSSFLSRQLAQDEEPGQQQHTRGYNQLEEACWNGLMQLILPEIFEEPLGTKDLFMWKVTGLDSFIGMELANFPSKAEIECSIEPSAFLRSKILS